MAVAGTIYLTRKANGQFVKLEGVTAVELTGQIATYGSVTGVEATNIITVAGSAFVDGTQITFQSITGGAGLTAGPAYYVVSASGTSFSLALTRGGSAINFTTDITAGVITAQTDELQVWSSEFRDIFTGPAEFQFSAVGASTDAVDTPGAILGQGAVTITPPVGGLSAVGMIVNADSYIISNSDEMQHYPLRQTFLNRTHWKFTMSAAPSPLYATWADGDIISNNPPNT